MTELAHRPRWVYNDGGAGDFTMALPMRPHTPGSRGLGGSDVSAAGVPAAFEIRRDPLLHMTLRFYEWEWPDVERVVRHLQRAGSVTLHDALTGLPLTVYGESPSIADEILPRRADAGTLELDITVRRTTAAVIPATYFDDAFFRFSAAAPGAFTFTRSTTALGMDSDGLLQEFAANVPRTEYVDLDGDGIRETPTRLLERAGGNAYDFSDDLSDSSWTKVRSSVALTASIASPRGVASASAGVFALVEDTQTGQHVIEQTLPALTDDTRQATSFWVRPSTRSVAYIETVNKANRTDITWFNLSTGAVGTTDADHVAVRIRRGPFGGALRWWRVTVIWDAGTGGTTPRARLGISTGDGVISYTGDGSSQIYVWNPQFETDQPVETSDVVTDSATDGVRGADALSIPIEFTPDAIIAAGGATFYGRWQEAGTAFAPGLSGSPWRLGNATTPGTIIVRRDNTSGDGRYDVAISVNGSQVAVAEPAGVVAVDDVVEVVVQIAIVNALARTATVTAILAIDGVQTGTATTGTFTLPTGWSGDVVVLSSGNLAVADRHIGHHGLPGIRSLAEMRAA
jgi:hypothetical protein